MPYNQYGKYISWKRYNYLRYKVRKFVPVYKTAPKKQSKTVSRRKAYYAKTRGRGFKR